MRIRLTDLAASTDYALQVRAKNSVTVSEWSRVFEITTATDSVSPNTPTGVTGSMTGTSFNISWNAVTTSTDGTPAYDLVGYEVLVASSGTGTTKVYPTTDTKFQFTLEMNREVFTTPRSNIIMSVRAVDLAGNVSSYSSTVDQTNAAPAAPTNLVITELVDSIGLSWDANTTDTDLIGYEVRVSTTGSGGTYTKIWSGTATSMVHSTNNYATDHWYRVYAVDIFGTLSTALQSGAAARPGSTFTIDTTPPAVPTGLTATITTGAAPNFVTYASVSWSAVADPDNDLAGYRIGYRPVGATVWQYADADNEQTSMQINNLTPYINYEFRIRSYDFMANYSNWSSTFTTNTAASNSAPSQPAAPTLSVGTQYIQVTHSGNKQAGGAMEADVDHYEVYLSTNSGFTPSAATMVGTIPAGPVRVGQWHIPAVGTLWYGKVIAVDTGGLSSPASPVSASANPNLIQTANIGDATITTAKIVSLEANKITAGTGIINNLTVKSILTLGDASTNGILQSYNYVSNTSGYQLDKDGLEINEGVIKAVALQIQDGHNLMPPAYADFEYTDFYYISSFWNSRGQGGIAVSGGLTQSSTGDATYKPFKGSQYLQVSSLGGTAASAFWLGKTDTDYNVEVTAGDKYIFSVYARNQDPTSDPDWVVRFKRNDNGAFLTETLALNHAGTNMTNWVRYQVVFTVPSGVTKLLVNFNNADTTHAKAINLDCAQIEKVEAGLETASQWKPPASTVIAPAGITTGYLRSTQNVSVSGTDVPSWSLNKEGNIQVGDALIRGKLFVGTTSEMLVNLAPNSGNFETDVTGYTAYTVGGSSPAITRTTTGGEVISGSGSAKVTLAAGAKTAIGIQFNLTTSVPANNYIRVVGSVKPTTSEGSIYVRFYDAGNAEVAASQIRETVVANDTYTFDEFVNIESGANTVTYARIIQEGTLTSTSIIFDDIIFDASSSTSHSYVSSPNFQVGASGWRVWGSGDVEFNNGVFRGTLGANMVTAETLASELVISSQFKTGSSGRRVEFGSSGVVLYGSSNETLVNLSTESDAPALVNADLVAQSLTVTDQMAIRGTNNELSKAATLTIQAGTTDPTSPPSVGIGYDQIQVNDDEVWRDYRYGLAYSSTDNAYMTVQNIYGAKASVVYWNKTTGSQFWTQMALQDIVAAYGGITVIGSEAFILGQNAAGVWKVEVRNLTTKAYVRTMDVGSSFDYNPTIGNDGTNLVLAYPLNADKRIRFRVANKTTMANVNVYTSDFYITTGSTFLTSCGYTATSLPGNFYFTRDNDKKVYVLSSTGQKIAAASSLDFTSPNTIRGMVQADVGDGAGSVFHTYNNSSGKVTKHSNASWAGDSTSLSTWHVAMTWYDSNATGGTHETKRGPITTFTMVKRAGLTISSPPLPLRPTPNTSDDAVAVGLYMARNSSTPTDAQLERQYYLPDGDTVTYLHRNGGTTANLPTAGNNATNPPPSSNGFSGLTTSPGKIRSSNDVFYVDGNGAGEWGPLIVSSAGALSMDAAYTNSVMRPSDTGVTGTEQTTTSADVVYSSGPKVDFTAPPSGTVKISVISYTKNATANRYAEVKARVRAGTSTSSGTIMADTPVLSFYGQDYIRAGGTIVVTGLTSGATYNVHLTISSQSGGTAYISGSRIVLEPTM